MQHTFGIQIGEQKAQQCILVYEYDKVKEVTISATVGYEPDDLTRTVTGKLKTTYSGDFLGLIEWDRDCVFATNSTYRAGDEMKDGWVVRKTCPVLKLTTPYNYYLLIYKTIPGGPTLGMVFNLQMMIKIKNKLAAIFVFSYFAFSTSAVSIDSLKCYLTLNYFIDLSDTYDGGGPFIRGVQNLQGLVWVKYIFRQFSNLILVFKYQVFIEEINKSITIPFDELSANEKQVQYH